MLCFLWLFYQLKSFHNELLTQLEQKVELDSRYLSVSSTKSIFNVNYITGCISISILLVHLEIFQVLEDKGVPKENCGLGGQ